MGSRSISTRLLAGLLQLPWLLFACGGDSPSATGSEDRILDRSDLQVVYRVGGLDGPGPALGEHPFAAFDASGRLHLLDGSNRKTLMLDLQGEVVWEYGREGRGPGEFSYPTGFGVTVDGRQVVADMGNGTLVQVDAAGELEGTMRVADGVGFPTGNLIVLDREVLALPDPDQYATAAPEDTLAWRIRAYHLDRPDARVWGEVWRAPEPEGTGEPLTLGGRTLSVRVAGLTHLRSFWPRPRLARAGEVLALFDSTSYEVNVYRADGTHARIVDRAIAPLPVTEAIRNGERDRRRGVIDAGEGPRFQLSGSDGSAQGVHQAMVDDFVREQIDVMSFWPEIPVLRDVLGGPDGSLWVQRNDNYGQPGRIDLFDADGVYRGTLPADSPFPIALGPDGLAAYVDVSELGVTELRVESWLGAKPSVPR